MKQTLVIWLCILALFASGCPKQAHVAERTDNAAISLQHDLALADCLTTELSTIKAGGDKAKAHIDFVACSDAADKKYGKTP